MATKGQHDMGGDPGGPIDLEGHDPEPWAKMLTAVVNSLREAGYLTVDEVRRALEDLPAEEYDLDYFERWSAALTNLMAEKDLLTREEIEGRMQAIRTKLGDA